MTALFLYFSLLYTFQRLYHIDLLQLKIHRSVYQQGEQDRQKESVYKTAQIDITPEHDRLNLYRDNDESMQELPENDAKNGSQNRQDDILPVHIHCHLTIVESQHFQRCQFSLAFRNMLLGGSLRTLPRRWRVFNRK